MAHTVLEEGFWGERQELISANTIPHADHWMSKLGWYSNLDAARKPSRYEHRGREFADSEVYKIVEAISWDLARGESRHAELLERLVVLVQNAQDPDGYLHTLFGRAWQRPRYSDWEWGHELYCFGHFIQAAVAHHRATADPRLLETATRLADHVCVMFGEGGLNHVCGHAEVEMALVELYRETGEKRYLTQAATFVERRGEGTMPLHEFGPAYWQDDMKVRDATVLRGHAVRALYLACGAVDVAVESDDRELLRALERQWERTVSARTYITGGMGSHHTDEGFGEDFVLPPDRSYCETCAGVASIMFSWRLLLATGQARYADLIERTLYNMIATAPSPDGRAFFYANTLHQRIGHQEPCLNDDGVVIRGGASGRQPWYEVSCCPPNLSRMLTSLGGYVATGDANGCEIHHYVSGSIEAPAMTLSVETGYPANGEIAIRIVRAEPGVRLRVRVPAWAEGAVVHRAGAQADVKAGDYAVIESVEEGELITLSLPMTPRFSYPDARVDALRGTVAVERGPEVFALESVDLPEGWLLDETYVDVANGIAEQDGRLSVSARRVRHGSSPWPFGSATSTPEALAPVDLVRYHSWAERGESTMRVFIPVAATPARGA